MDYILLSEKPREITINVQKRSFQKKRPTLLKIYSDFEGKRWKGP